MFNPLHAGSGAVVFANVFDAGSARIVAGLGFEIVATSSGGFAATDLPPSADLEHGFGDASEAVAETKRGTAQAGLVRCTIEDAAKDKDQPIYPFDAALERISAGVEATRSPNFDFKLMGQCKNFLRGKPV